jgi:hypothetical protein
MPLRLICGIQVDCTSRVVDPGWRAMSGDENCLLTISKGVKEKTSSEAIGLTSELVAINECGRSVEQEERVEKGSL